MPAFPLTLAAAIPIVIWLLLLLRSAFYGSKIRRLITIPLPDAVTLQKRLPRLSIVLSARNEHEAMVHSVPKLLAVNYPSIEFILVNDRSSDDTGQLIDRMAALDPRVKAIHIEGLPDGWLGKVHALARASEVATGEWLLFTDADIHFEADVLERAVYVAESERLEMVCVIPENLQEHSHALLNAFVMAFGILFVQTAYEPRLRQADEPDYIGIGAFNLVRRAAYDRSPGLEWLRLEVLDDIGIGLMVKRAGGSIGLFFGDGLLKFQWYPTLRAMIKGLEKNTFGGFGRYSYVRMSLLLLAMLYLVIGPLAIATISGSMVLLAAYGGVYFIIPGLVTWAAAAIFPVRPLEIMLVPIGMLCLIYAGFRSMLATWRQKGIRWRETFYPLAELRKMQRIKL